MPPNLMYWSLKDLLHHDVCHAIIHRTRKFLCVPVADPVGIVELRVAVELIHFRLHRTLRWWCNSFQPKSVHHYRQFLRKLDTTRPLRPLLWQQPNRRNHGMAVSHNMVVRNVCKVADHIYTVDHTVDMVSQQSLRTSHTLHSPSILWIGKKINPKS